MERMGLNKARKRLSNALSNGTVAWTRHAREAMRDRQLQMPDVLNILRCGQIYEEPESIHGTWRYRVHTELMCAVVAFRAPDEVVVVTAWRKR